MRERGGEPSKGPKEDVAKMAGLCGNEKLGGRAAHEPKRGRGQEETAVRSHRY